MELMNRIILVLKKPYPLEESRVIYFKYIAAVSLFVTFFLYIFQPFGIGTIESGLFLICLGFGLMTFVASILYDFIANAIFKINDQPDTFTFGKWIIYIIGLMFCISLANFLFVRALMGSMRWEFFPHMLYATFTIGVFPTVVIGGISLLRQEKKYQNIASQINEKSKDNKAKIPSNEVLLYDIAVYKIRYIEALQNYVKIGFVNSEDQLVEKTERATLKSLIDQLEETSIVKCHRSFLVNKESIVSTSGNAQGLILTLSECDRKVPVSRSYVSVFRDS